MVDAASATVLVVDDEEAMRKVATITLRRAGYNVIAAGGSAEAMEVLQQTPGIALLFTDIKMPGIDGFRLADMAKVSRPKLKVIYATGYLDEVDPKPGVRHGPILDKPYTPEQLRHVVRLALKD
jgi:CheY-like chemotaxis protein